MTSNAEGPWRACPQGELTRLGARLRGRRRRRIAVQATGALAVLLTCAGLWSLASYQRDNNYAGLTCSQVIELAMAYGEGTLDPELCGRVRSHVEQCPHCHDRFEEMGLLSQPLPERWIRLAQLVFDHPHDPPDEQAHARPS